MKRALVTTWFLCAAALLGGCPIYNHEDDGCYRDRDCAPGYYCDDRSGDCIAESVATTCSRPSQCTGNQTCNRQGVCVSGDCTFNGCVAGYLCSSDSGIWSCVPRSTSGGSAGAAGEPAAGASGAAGAGGAGGSSEPGGAGMSAVAGESGSAAN